MSDVEITPYLNPNHWDGHTLGVGDPIGNSYDSYNFGDSRYARRIINNRVRSNSVVPLHTFYNGDSFSPAGYEPGTVVLFSQELLYGDAVEGDYDLGALAAQEVPVRSTATSPSFGRNTPFTVAEDGKRHYMSSVRWGVVPRHNPINYLSSTPASTVLEKGTEALACSPFINIHAPIVVGETVHYPQNSEKHERLRRVNILHVIAYGTPEKQKSRIFAFLGKPALGHTR